MNTQELKDLERFVTAQDSDYEQALTEIRYGKKQSHWMWYIFPQIQGLGFSEFARYYAIQDLREALAFLAHPLLGPRLLTISKALLAHTDLTAREIFGSPDDLKLRSSMTLFAATPGADPVFQQVLDQFFQGDADQKTRRFLNLQGYGEK